MGLFETLFKKKTTTDVAFECVKYEGRTTLENNFNGVINNPKWEDVQQYIGLMLENEQEFVTLTLSECMYGVRFMQACRIPDGISVQLGLEKDNVTKLVEKVCNMDQAIKYFDFFYQYAYVEDVKTFEPLQF